ncbi:hypothetical protein CVT25_001456 [Psilocybe cyanescens]|uniref:Uncharacterized protein n=1 Tax=Psilocybe cyanescens TaxID=93625 RepID=A0A409WNT1_PSICY|nr:hypothetical protein CVT25_001456 [Psilocybe cyanescens]
MKINASGRLKEKELQTEKRAEDGTKGQKPLRHQQPVSGCGSTLSRTRVLRPESEERTLSPEDSPTTFHNETPTSTSVSRLESNKRRRSSSMSESLPGPSKRPRLSGQALERSKRPIRGPNQCPKPFGKMSTVYQRGYIASRTPVAAHRLTGLRISYLWVDNEMHGRYEKAYQLEEAFQSELLLQNQWGQQLPLQQIDDIHGETVNTSERSASPDGQVKEAV